MHKLVKLPLAFLFIASLIGLALRWHYYRPIEAFNYTNWLHAHSHIMFLGWAFNALSMGFVVCFVQERSQAWYKWPFYLINLTVLGMLIAFPIQGYAFYSIAVSTLHTVFVVVLGVRFFKDTRAHRQNNAVWFARASLLFFLVSAVGPFVVGALAAKGLGHSDGYFMAIYYYLHFQYNGVFTFGALALFFYLLEQMGIVIDLQAAKWFRWTLFVSCFPAYALSTLWAGPPPVVYGVGLLAATGQLLALYFLLRSMRGRWAGLAHRLLPLSRTLMAASLVAFMLKLALQLFSAFPSVALLAFERRFYIIAYLHLVLLGFVTFFLLAWYSEQYGMPLKRWFTYLLLAGFVSSELVMVSVGQWPGLFNIQKWMFITSAALVLGIVGIATGAFRKHGPS